MHDFKDESFILQFLSPKVIRDLKLFAVLDDDEHRDIEITAIHDEQGYRYVRELLADQYNLSKQEPNIQIYNVDLSGDRSITLHHTQHNRIPLHEEDASEVVKHLHNLWQFDVHLHSIQNDNISASFECTDSDLKIVTPQNGEESESVDKAP